ncbi:MAG: hypothetical protein Q4A81_06600 [Pasteurellaceae bacterium]|nr:hypothetical protein [Pasteurellaceae bacterium]
MNLVLRLELLKKRQLINSELIKITFSIRNRLSEKWQVDITCQQVDMILLHLVNALGRIQRGCCAMAMHAEIWREIQNAPQFPQVMQLHQDILKLIPFPIPQSEQSHFIGNWYSLSLAQPWILIAIV